MAFAVFFGVFGSPLPAQPTGGQVVAGAASIASGPGALTVTQTSGRAIIHWQDFSIAAGELARFIQPDAASATLNRVVSGLPSSLAGSLQANGQVYLINPNGILVGAGARIDTGGFLASTLDVANNEFLAGGDLHFSGGSTAAITNLGAINALGGDVFLIARQVENSGTITAGGGVGGLGAGSEILLTAGGDERLFIHASSAPGTVVNSGTIAAATAELKAAGGNAYALAINNSGTVRATGSAVRNGQIWLVATGDSTVVNSGTLDASGRNPGETGGSIKVLGQYVGLFGAAELDASGDAGGGTILVGGDFQGDNPDVRNAYRTYVGSDVTIKADAINSGNGGRGIVWANDTTRFYGAISARGGAQGGDGGFVETSGKVNLQAFGSVDASAPNGAAGQWLLDPNNITIQSAGSDTNVSATPNFTSSADSAIVTTGSIDAALNGGTSVTITTGSGGAQAGNITVASNISKTLGADAALVLLAHNNIIVNGGISISSTSNKLDVTLNADGDASGAGNIQMNSASAITTNGGNITLGGGATPLTTPAVGSGTGTLADKAGIYLNNAALDAGAGDISLRGTGKALTFSTNGIYALGGTVIQTTSGTITLNGTGGTGAGANNNYGVYLTGGGTSIQSAIGAISITGTGGGAGSGSGYNGIYLEGGAKVISTGAATITLNGTGGGATNSNHGVVLVDAGSGIESANGAISITGTAGGPGGYGILLFGGPDVISTGAATITLNGTGGGGGTAAGSNYGIYIHGAGTSIQSANAAISITGTGGAGTGDLNYGIQLISDADVISTDSATITLLGTGGAGTGFNHGLFLNGVGTSIQSAHGAISMTGTGTGNDSYGLLLANSSGVLSNGSAPITLTGSGAGNYAGILSYGAGGPNLIGGASSTGDITLAARTATGTDSISFSNQTISGTGNLYLQPLDAVTTSGIAGGAGIFNLSIAELNLISNGFASITIGRADGTGLITFGDGAGGGAGYTFNDNLTLRNPGAGSSGISTTDLLALGGNNLVLHTTGAVTQTAAITAAGLELIGTGGTHTLTNSGNAITTLAGNTGTINYSQAGSLIIGTVNTAGLTASNTILVGSTGAAANLTLNNAVAADGAGDALVLAAGQNFFNNVGTTALDAGAGRWLVYSTSPAGSTENGLTAIAGSTLPRLYNRTFADNAPATIAAGNHLIYSAQPSLTATADNATRVYGAANPTFTATITGFVNDDGVTDVASSAGLTGAAGLTSLANATSNVADSPFAITAAAGDLASSAGYAFTFAHGELAITKANLMLSGTRVFNGTTVFTAANLGSVATGANGETFALTGNGALSSKNVQTAQPLADVSGLALGLSINGGLAGNYNALATTGSSVSVTTAPITVSTTDVVKVYDGGTTASGTPTVTGGTLFAGDTLTVGGLAPSFVFTNKNVGAGNKTVAVSGIGVSDGNNGNNYTVTLADNTTSTINQADLTLSGTRIYDGSTSFAGGNLTATGVNGESFTVTGAGVTGNLGTKNVQTNQLLASVSGLTIGTGNSGAAVSTNYNLTTANSTVSVTPAALTIAGFASDDKVYDGLTTAVIASPGTLSGVVLGDTVGFSNTGASFATPNVGTGKTVTLNGVALTGSGDQTNYTYTATTTDLSNITAATLTYTATPANRLYGASNPAFSGTVTGFVPGETLLSATTGSAAFTSSATPADNVGAYAILGSGLTANSGNYILVQAAGNATAFTINRGPLTIAADNQSKIYGAALPTFTASYAGLLNGDSPSVVSGLTLTTTATAASNVGTSAITAANGNAANYTITHAPGALSITPAPLTITADNQSRAAGTPDPVFTATYLGLVNNDTTAAITGLSLITTALASSPIGSYPITPSGATAANYSISFVNGLLAINQNLLTITADNQSKTYGAPLPTFTASYTGLLDGDTSSVVTGLQFSTTATISSNVGTFTITPFGATAPASYLVSYVPGTLTINPGALTLTANRATRLYGATNPAFSGTFAGFVNGDTAAIVTGAQYSTTASTASNVGSYAITPFGATAPNYTFSFVPGTLTIDPASLTLSATNAEREFGAANPAFTATFSGLVNGDTAAVVSGLIFNTPATATSASGTYAITPSGATAANYTLAFVNGTLRITVPTVTVGTTPQPVFTINDQPALSSELAVIPDGGRLVLVPVDSSGGVLTATGGSSGSIDQRLTLTLDDATDLPDFGSQTALAGSTATGANSTNAPNLGRFELVTTFNGGVGETGASGRESPGGLGSVQMNDPGLFRESTVSMGGYNVVYHEALTDARQQAEDNTALGSSYREFSDSDDPQVNLVRAKVERKPAETTSSLNLPGTL